MRPPAVAGMFYPAEPRALSAAVGACFGGTVPRIASEGPGRLAALIAPHAGYRFSGSVAARAYAELAADGWPEHFVLVGPAHYGSESPIAVSSEDWQTPLGTVPCDRALLTSLVDDTDWVVDDRPHRREHALETQLPFLQALAQGSNRPLSVVPVALGLQDETTAEEFARGIGRARGMGRTLIVASSDLAHVGPDYSHEPPIGVSAGAHARTLDEIAIHAARTGSPDRLLEAVRVHDVPSCGHGAIACALAAARGSGRAPPSVRLLEHRTSYDVAPGPSCVGYAALAIEPGD